MLKQIVHLIALIILVVSFSGCWSCPEPEPVEPKVITETKYIKVPFPKTQDKPEFIEYEMNLGNLNGTDYYFMTIPSGATLNSNWIVYKDWAETNYKTLIKLEKIDIKSIKK